MRQRALVERLAEGIADARRSANFCVGGCLPEVDPGIEAADVGVLKLPLKPMAAKRLMAACRPAPYGKGTKTLVDRRVRNSLELAPADFKLTNPKWDEALRQAVRAAAERLGLPAERLEATLYKLLVYREGGFFQPHRDSEKNDRMVASLIVALPSPFAGGKLTVRHRGMSESFAFAEAAAGQAPCFAAFYADCEHEVSRVSSGVRLCLAYNLTLAKEKRGRQRAAEGQPPAESSPAEMLARSISQWAAEAKSEPLVFALDHHYTQHGLALDLLKGTDRATADLVVAAAEQAGCRAYLCQVSRHLSQYADDGYWGGRSDWRRGRRVSGELPDNLELGEVYEDELCGEEWVDAAGKRQSFPGIGLSPGAIVASTPLDKWKPTRQDYEGFTGNAGNTLDRWYHRSAVCIWPRDRHYEVLASGGVDYAVELLGSLLGKLKKSSQKRREALRGECLQLARAIIGRWPKSYAHQSWRKGDNRPSYYAFPEMLAELGHLGATRAFLKCVAERDPNLDLNKLIVRVCRRRGCAALADELRGLFQASQLDCLSARNFAWLERLAAAQGADPDARPLLEELAVLAAQKFCQTPAPRSRYHGDSALPKRTLPALICTLLALADDETLTRVVEFVRSQPERFSFGKVQVPALKAIVSRRRKRGAAIHPLLRDWLGGLQQELQAATAREPQPPADWARPDEVECSCRFCAELKAFLADPLAETGRIKAPEANRSHVIDRIRHHECDVTHKLEKKGSPYALVLTKTNGSFERQVRRHAANCKLLETVEELLAG